MVGNGETNDPSSGFGIPGGCDMMPRNGWPGSMPVLPNARHLDGANYLAADGHVKWYQPQEVSRGYRATSSTAGESFYGGSGSYYAQGTN